MPSGLVPSFRINLGNAVLPGLVTIGRFDGEHPSLVAATSASHLLLHSPHTRQTRQGEQETRTININRNITAVACGDMEVASSGSSSSSSSSSGRDLLLIGSATSLQCYDVEVNRDVFFKEVPDGVRSLCYGRLPHLSVPLALVGGNCSLQGFNSEGQESFWTVTGDNVSAMCMRENKEGKQELLVGSEDFEIRCFASEEVMFEVSESDIVSGLTGLTPSTYGYALANGTVGVYQDRVRVWHAKSKHTCESLTSFDLNQDGVPELITGWSSGRMEVRLDTSGFLVYKDKLNASVAKLMTADYRMDGRMQIVAVTTDGEVRGYAPPEAEQADTNADLGVQEAQLKELYEKRNALLAELRGLEKNVGGIKQPTKGPHGHTHAHDPNAMTSSHSAPVGLIPTNTKLSVTSKPNKTTGGIILTLSTNNDTHIKLAILLNEHLFADGSLLHHPKQTAPTLAIPLKIEKNQQTELLIKAVVGHRASTQDHVFEVTHTLPRFAQFIYTKPKELAPRGQVSFHTSERVNRVVLWINQSFAADPSAPMSGIHLSVTSDSLHAGFLSVGDGHPLIIRMGPENGGTLTIRCDSMELAGDIIQDLGRYLALTNLDSTADFPDEMGQFEQVLAKVEEYNAQRLKMSADIADTSNVIKTLVIKAEDARILNDVENMTKYYSQLHQLNREMVGEYRKRAHNHADLLASLKEVNHMIQRAARLRLGEAKQRVVQACRMAIKQNNTKNLMHIIKLGHAA